MQNNCAEFFPRYISDKKLTHLENTVITVYRCFFRQPWLVLRVKLMEINSNLFSRPLKKLQVPVDYSDDWLPEGTQTDGGIRAGTSRKEVMEWGI